MSHAPATLEGWYALHDVRHFDRTAWEQLSSEDRHAITREAVSFFEAAERVEDAEEGSSALFRILGHKGDLMILHFRPTLDELHELGGRLSTLQISRYLRPATSFVSVVELSRHGDTDEDGQEPEEPPELSDWLKRRLMPEIPEMRHVCFYPMNKRRGEQVNWFTLPADERAELMESHGTTGRKYAGKVLQVITGAMGFDDWEWGVTLFAHDPLQFKKLVYEMRFDRVSALYADFGPFYIGRRMHTDTLAETLLR